MIIVRAVIREVLGYKIAHISCNDSPGKKLIIRIYMSLPYSCCKSPGDVSEKWGTSDHQLQGCCMRCTCAFIFDREIFLKLFSASKRFLPNSQFPLLQKLMFSRHVVAGLISDKKEISSGFM